MLIVDAQVHIWSAGPPTNQMHRQVNSYTAEECIRDMDAAGVDACLLHPPGWDPNSGAVSEAAAKKYPNRFAILGNFPLDKPESRSLIDTWKQRPGMLGLRYAFTQPHQANWMTDGTMDWLWPAAERAGLPVALLAGEFLPLLGEIARRHPGLRLIVDHMAAVRNRQGAAAFETMPALVALARHPNIAVKATGGPSYAEDVYPFRSLHPYYRRLYDAFGPMRMFWGTDITRMPCSWRHCVTAFTEEMPFLSERDRELIMGRALCDWIGWA